MKYLIVFQSNEEDSKYADSVASEIERIDPAAIKVTSSIAIVSTEVSVAQCAERLKSVIGAKDGLLITRLTSESHIQFGVGEMALDIPRLDESKLADFTVRQLEILRLIGDGKSTSEIAKLLYVSSHTIESHKENIKKRLGLSNARQLLKFAIDFVAG